MKELCASSLSVALAGALFGGMASVPRLAAQGMKSAADGVYTEEQATRGAEVYRRACASCHMPDLRGEGFAPQLDADAFALRWEGGTVGDLFKIIKGTMPQENPDSLTPAEYAGILAFLLKANGYKAGPQPLAEKPGDSAQILFPKKPSL